MFMAFRPEPSRPRELLLTEYRGYHYQEQTHPPA